MDTVTKYSDKNKAKYLLFMINYLLFIIYYLLFIIVASDQIDLRIEYQINFGKVENQMENKQNTTFIFLHHQTQQFLQLLVDMVFVIVSNQIDFVTVKLCGVVWFGVVWFVVVWFGVM